MAEHAVFLHFPLAPSPAWSWPGEGWPELQRRLEDCLEALGTGRAEEFDLYAGEAIFYLYGGDADALMVAAGEVLRQPGAPRPCRVVVRRGAFDDPDAAEQEVGPVRLLAST